MTLDLELAQSELEYSTVVKGEESYREEVKRQGVSGSRGGKAITSSRDDEGLNVVQVLASVIEEHVKAVAGGDARAWGTALGYLIHIDPEQAAYLTIRHTMDAAAVNKLLNTAAVELGNAVQDHVHVMRVEKQAPGLYATVVEQLKTSTSERHRTAVLRRVIDRQSKGGKDPIKLLGWSQTDKLHVGSCLIELFEQCADIIRVNRDTESSCNTPVRVVFQDAALEWIEKANDKVFRPVHVPMVSPPREWRGETSAKADGKEFFQITGGYLTEAMWRSKFILSRVPGLVTRMGNADLSRVFSAVNRVQGTAWRVNKAVLEVARGLRDTKRFEHLYFEPLEEMPAELPESARGTEEWTDRMADRARIHEENNKRRSKRYAAVQQLALGHQFADYERIYFPHRLDFRGRIYPYAVFLQPQADDLGKGLLTFAHSKMLGDTGLRWLMIHAANCGAFDKMDKAPFEARVAWTKANMQSIRAAAADPAGYADWWGAAESPWCFLAACIELDEAMSLPDPTQYFSSLPIAMDGSCSGLQHYSAALRDEVGGELVNLMAGQRHDIYEAVAKSAQALSDGSTYGTDESRECQDAWRGKISRGVVKQPTMTLCYAATLEGWREQIEKAIKKNGIDLGDVKPRKAARYLAQVLDLATGQVVVAAKDGMKFLKDCAKVMAKAGLPIVWHAPNGFRVEQAYFKNKAKRVQVIYRGVPMKLTLVEPINQMDAQRQAQSIAPNFVHALDSSHLMATVNAGFDNGIEHWSVIHDSFGCHACDVDVMHAVIRRTFISQYSVNVFHKFREELAEQLKETHPKLLDELPALPPVRGLNLEGIISADYFFA